jgi:hypothetical protein
VKAGALRQMALLIAAVAVLSGAGWVVFGSAATLPVTPRNASAFRTCVLTGYPTATTVMFDTWADENSPTSRKATGDTLQVQSNTGRNNRPFLRFDLQTKCVPAIASTATVKKATLRLTLNGAPSASRTYNVNRVTGPCPEAATTCWTETSLTWNNQPAVAASPTATLALTSSSTTNQYYAFDVTADVVAMIAGTVSNYGWRIADSAEGNVPSVIATFKSKDASSNAAGAPELVVVYSP